MKKLLSFLAILAIIFSSNCTRIEQNNDPIIGIWAETTSITESNPTNNNVRTEWIFNDVYLGRYHEITNGEITVQTDFKWSKENETYTVEYRGLENKPNDIVTIEKTATETLLQEPDGAYLAIKE